MPSKKYWFRLGGLLLIFLFIGIAPSSADTDTILDTEPKPTTLLNENLEVQPDSEMLIHLAIGSFDPLQELPSIPESLAFSPEEETTAGTYILQFTGPVLPEWKQALVEIGGILGDYLPEYAFLVYLDPAAKERATQLPFVRWIGPYQPAYKLAPDVDFNDSRSYRISLAPWPSSPSIQNILSEFDPQTQSYAGGYSAVLDGDALAQVARLPEVTWIEPYHLQHIDNNVGGGTIMGGSTAWANGYTGSGIKIGVADTGLDTGIAGNIHQDFSGRVTNISSWAVQNLNWGSGCSPTNVGADDGADDTNSGHGTHVAGSVAGNGTASGGNFKGLGFEATITFQAIEQYTTWASGCPLSDGYYLTGIPADVRQLLDQAYGWGARVHNNSWGGGPFGVYDTQASQFDSFVFSHPDMAVVVSAGNEGIDANADGFVDQDSISSPATAKNLITVGASDNERTSGGIQGTWFQYWGNDYPTNPTRNDYVSDSRQELAAFSSRGPMDDGRIKPDVVAPGTNILSVRSSQATQNGWGWYNTYYMYMGGTSMASPLTAGAATLVHDYYIDAEGLNNPSAALIKATLINTAVDISGYGNPGQEAGLPIPNNHEGWGLVNVAAATTPGKRQFVDETNGVGTGATQAYYYLVNAGTPLKITLVWSDYQGSPAAGKALVNNLNLRVTAPNGTTQYWGNHFGGGWSQAGGNADTLNNVENVYVQSPAAGTWTIEVIGYNVPQGPLQPFALLVNGNVETFTLTSISPDHAFNNATLSVAVVRGTGFDAAATVQLKRGGMIIPGTSVVVNTSNDTISADFALNGATPGLWDVVVTNPGQSATLKEAFRVLDSTLPDLVVTKTTDQSEINPGNWLTYTLQIKNMGYVTATGVVFTDTFPQGVSFDSLQPVCEGGVVTLPDGFACHVQPTTLPAGSTINYTLVVFVPGDVYGVLLNQVTVASAQVDAYPEDNSDEARTLSGQVRYYLPVALRDWSSSSEVPGAPTLNPIANNDHDGNYTITWQAGAGPAPTAYDLEENGAIILTNYTKTSYNVSGKAAGTYTYRVRAKNINGNSPWSNQQSATVNPVANPIMNGDFENGRDGSWTEYSSNNYALIVDSFGNSDVTPHSGEWAAWLGGVLDELSTLTQQVPVPTTSPTLTYWIWSNSGEPVCGYDVGHVLINSTIVDTINLCIDEATNIWVKRSIDLGAYSGQTVSIQFYVLQDDIFISNLFLDDVAIE